VKKLFRSILHWEKWPFKLLYFPISFVWLWYCFRSRSFWFFTPSNPTITFGGFQGEGKKEMYDQLPPEWYPKTVYIDPDSPFSLVQKKLRDNGISFPLVVKPDVGMKGLLFRKIDSLSELEQYHQKLPVVYLIQELVDYPVEVSVFYYRYPNAPQGVVSGFIQKELLEVNGNGVQSLEELIKAHPKASRRWNEMENKHQKNFGLILPSGTTYTLSFAGNHNRGATFISLAQEIDEQMQQTFDAIFSKVPHFFYGRYDIKCKSIQALKEGHSFSILEYNGCGAEPNHIYDAGFSLLKAYKIILTHWKALFEISSFNRKNGYPVWSHQAGKKFLKESAIHFKRLEELDAEIP
jgi:hypothetical protein